MAISTRALVVANRTADSEGLAEALLRRAAESDVQYTLLVPATPTGAGRAAAREAARRQLDAALDRLRDVGLDAEGTVGDPDPVVAVDDIWSPGLFDEVIVSTLSRDTSRWVAYDLPHRISRLIDCPVTHVVPSEVERELARARFRRPLRHAPQRALGPFVGPADDS
jgi:hypothetical protein